MGRVIIAANAGMKKTLEATYRRGIWDVTVKIRGTTQISARYGREEMKSEATIMKTIATSLTSGFKACNKPRLPLKSST
jgi:hypothetical protein